MSIISWKSSRYVDVYLLVLGVISRISCLVNMYTPRHIHTHKYMVIYICKSKYHWVITWWVLQSPGNTFFLFSKFTNALVSSSLRVYPKVTGSRSSEIADEAAAFTASSLWGSDSDQSKASALETACTKSLLKGAPFWWGSPPTPPPPHLPPPRQHILFQSCLCKEAGVSNKMAAFRNAIWEFRRQFLPGIGLMLTSSLTRWMSELHVMRCQEVSPWAHIIRLVISNHFSPKSGHYILLNLIYQF